MTANQDFLLSRFYAKGWAAGAQCTAEELGGDMMALAETLNPGTNPAERERWAQGFTEAVARSQDQRDRRKPGFTPRRGDPA
jgi:truncated hemoglobin YjbI